MKLQADNLTVEIIEAYDSQTKGTTNRLSIEPGYIDYLRGNGYPIDDITDVQAVQSDSDTDKAHVVCKVHTLDYPRGHGKLDITADKVVLSVCDCWSWRSNSVDISKEENKPSDCKGCKHVRSAFRTESLTTV